MPKQITRKPGRPKKKREQKKHSSYVTSYHLRTAFFIFFFTILALFYPGNSYYTNLFSFHREIFASAHEKTQHFEVAPVPYVEQGTQQPFLTADAVYLIDLQSATPLLEKNQHKRLFPASTTKVITALTAYDYFDLEDVLVVERVIDEGQSMDLVQGEKIIFENLLYGILVHSGNDAAYVIADNYPGGYDAFIEAMGKKVESLGMKDTQLRNPAGLDSYTQYSSAFDLSLAGRELLKDKTLSKIVSTKSITVSDVDYKYFHPLYNINRLLGEIPGVAGLKSGKTDLAGENLITLYKNEEHDFLIVLLKSQDRFSDTQSLVKWINANVKYAGV